MSKVRVDSLSPDQLRAQIGKHTKAVARLTEEIAKFSALPDTEEIGHFPSGRIVTPRQAVRNLTRQKATAERELAALTQRLRASEAVDTDPATLAKYDQSEGRVVGVFRSHRITPERFAEDVEREVRYALAAGCDRAELARLLMAQAERTKAKEVTA